MMPSRRGQAAWKLLLLCICIATWCGSASAARGPGARLPGPPSAARQRGGLLEDAAVVDLEEALLARGGAGSQQVAKKSLAAPSSDLIGWAGVIGGALCHLALGTTYCWGNFSPYVPQHLKYFGAANGTPDTLWILPGAFLAQMVSMPFGPWFQRKLGCRATTLLGCWMMALGVFLSSYAQDLKTFFLFYSLMFGAGVGIAYTAPMVNGWRWFPTRKGLVSGCVVAGFGSGGFIFNQVGSRIINPNGVDAVNGVYPDAIYAAFPKMLRKLALIYFILTGLGSMLVSPPPTTSQASASGKVTAQPAKGMTLQEALRSRTFWTLWGTILLIGTSGINVAGVYKAFGSRLHPADDFQALVGSLAALANGAGRLFWGNILDAFGFKKPFAALVTLQAIAMALYSTVSSSKAGFIAATCTILFCLGGNFAMFPALTTKLFGGQNGALIYGVLFSAFSIASVAGVLVTKSLIASLGWDGVFKVMSALSVLALAVVSPLNMKFQD